LLLLSLAEHPGPKTKKKNKVIPKIIKRKTKDNVGLLARDQIKVLMSWKSFGADRTSQLALHSSHPYIFFPFEYFPPSLYI